MSRSPSRDRSASRAGRTLAAASGGGGGGGGFDPATMAGNVLWIRGKDLGSNGSSVTAPADQSPYGVVMTATGCTVSTGATPSGGKAFNLASGVITPTATPVGSISASSTLAGGVPITNLIDGSPSTRWASNATPVCWIALKMATAYAATSYTLTPYTTLDAPTSWTFRGLTNTTGTWTTLDTRTGVSWPDTNAQTFNFTNSTAYDAYQLNVTVAGPSYCQLTEFTLSGGSLLANGAEMWAVVKSNDASGQAWQLGASGSASHFTFTGTVYDASWATTRQSFSPSPTVAGAWRLYRVKNNAAGAWQAWIDNTSQTTATATFGPNEAPKLANSWTGLYAEILILDRTPSAGDITNLIAYFNTEHGLTVT